MLNLRGTAEAKQRRIDIVKERRLKSDISHIEASLTKLAGAHPTVSNGCIRFVTRSVFSQHGDVINDTYLR